MPSHLQKNTLIWASRKKNISKICLTFYQAQTILSRLLPAGMLTSLITDEDGSELARNGEVRKGWKMKGSSKQSCCYVQYVYVFPICMTTLWLMRTNMHRRTATVYGIWPENKGWSKQQEQISRIAVADNWSRTEAMPLISLRKSCNTTRGQKMRCDTSLRRLQPI